MEFQYIFLRLPESWYRKVEESASFIISLSVKSLEIWLPGSDTVKMWLNVAFFFLRVLGHRLCRGHPKVFAGSMGLPFYYAVGTLYVGCQTNKLGEM